jgi:hypothetical protein
MTFAPHIFAEVRLLKTAEGGRDQPTPSDLFDCSVGDGYFEMRMDLRGIGSLSPGSTAKVPIQFLRPEILMWLREGAVFSLREIGAIGSAHVIGSGKVLEFYDNLAA